MAISGGILTIVHGVLGLFLIIELGLTGYVVGQNNWFDDGTPSQFAFMLFCAVWSILVLAYLVASTFFLSHGHQGLVSLVLVGLTTLFWFAGSIAMADYIGVPDCDGNNYCQSAQAGVAFGFFIWAIFTALTVLGAMAFMGRGASVDSTRKPHQPYPGV